MKRHTRKDIEIALNALNSARIEEESIINKYSDNYKIWSKACCKVNSLKNKYNKIVREYNYDNGYNSNGLTIRSTQRGITHWMPLPEPPKE